MRVGINALYLIPGGVGGSEIYMRSLLSELARLDRDNAYFVFTNAETGRDLVPAAPNFSHLPQRVKAVSRPFRLIWEQTVLPAKAASLKLDVLFNGGYTAPLLCECPQVTVFYDLQHKRHPEYYRWYELPVYRALLHLSARVSRRIMTISQTSADDLRAFYPFAGAKTRVAPLGVDREFERVAVRRKPERFLLTVSTLHPHKNLEALLRAFKAFKETHPDFSLVICGLHGFASERIHSLQRELALDGSVRLPGWIDRKDVYDLYARAWAFVYPTLFEGFGLPLLEAMTAGVPTACSAIEPLASISGNQALLFNPKSDEELLSAMTRITDDELLRKALATGAQRRAAEFSWAANAKETLNALIDAAAPRLLPTAMRSA